jgi:hypothetical protein
MKQAMKSSVAGTGTKAQNSTHDHKSSSLVKLPFLKNDILMAGDQKLIAPT